MDMLIHYTTVEKLKRDKFHF